jgi:hypothetical protein
MYHLGSMSSVFIKSWNVDIRSLSAENQRSSADVGKIRDVVTSMGAIIPYGRRRCVIINSTSPMPTMHH